jgi:hypothetical protein
MGIENKPLDFEGMEAYLDRFEEEKMKFALSNQILGVSTMQLLMSAVPGPLHGFARRAAHALCVRLQGFRTHRQAWAGPCGGSWVFLGCSKGTSCVVRCCAAHPSA